MKLQILIVTLGLTTTRLLGQNIGAVEISPNAVTPWLPKLELEYEGLYRFGESESESDLKLFFVEKLSENRQKQGKGTRKRSIPDA